VRRALQFWHTSKPCSSDHRLGEDRVGVQTMKASIPCAVRRDFAA
jgi:hypothetical protein